MALISTKDMSREDWLKLRKNGIGGSDAGAIAGINPWRSAISVYNEKMMDDVEDIDNERMRIGRDLEDYVAQRFAEATGHKLRRKNAIIISDDAPYMLANIDREIVGRREGLECKTTNSYSAKDWAGEEIPPHYEIQCHHYMLVTGFEAWWIACLIGNERFVYKRIERDESIIENLRAIETDFWKNHIEPRIMPAPDGSKDAAAMLKALYPQSDPEKVVELPGLTNDVEMYQRVRQSLKDLELQKSLIEQEIQAAMMNAERAVIGDRKVTWKTIESGRIDSKALRADYPEICEKYTKISKSKRFEIK